LETVSATCCGVRNPNVFAKCWPHSCAGVAAAHRAALRGPRVCDPQRRPLAETRAITLRTARSCDTAEVHRAVPGNGQSDLLRCAQSECVREVLAPFVCGRCCGSVTRSDVRSPKRDRSLGKPPDPATRLKFTGPGLGTGGVTCCGVRSPNAFTKCRPLSCAGVAAARRAALRRVPGNPGNPAQFKISIPWACG
jgi:hypothetical protein